MTVAAGEDVSTNGAELIFSPSGMGRWEIVFLIHFREVTHNTFKRNVINKLFYLGYRSLQQNEIVFLSRPISEKSCLGPLP